MKNKLVIAALGIVLLVAFTATAMAETKVSFKGSYRARYFYKYNFNLGTGDEGEQPNGSVGYFDQRFRLGAKFMPSDKLSFNLDLQAINGNKWGTQTSGVEWSGYPGSTVTTGVDANGDPVTVDMSANDYDSSLEVRYAYIRYITSFGIFDVGRMSASTGGLANLGYFGDAFAEGVAPFDAEAPAQRIKYVLPLGNFTLVAIYQKSLETDAYDAFVSDSDVDVGIICGTIKWATGAANPTIIFVRNRANPAFDTNLYTFDPGFIQNFGPFAIHAELKYTVGTMEATADGGQDVDVSGLGIYLDGVYSYGTGSVALMAWYLTGDDDAADDETTDAVTIGGDHCPLMVLYDLVLDDNIVGDAANHWVVGGWWDHNITEDLMLHAALGYVSLVETADGMDDYYGSEVDFGVSYQIADGLSFSSMVGYFAPGDYCEDVNNGNDVEGAFAWKSTLEVSF